MQFFFPFRHIVHSKKSLFAVKISILIKEENFAYLQCKKELHNIGECCGCRQAKEVTCSEKRQVGKAERKTPDVTFPVKFLKNFKKNFMHESTNLLVILRIPVTVKFSLSTFVL